NWKPTIQARDFVLELQDYYQRHWQLTGDEAEITAPTISTTSISDPCLGQDDLWTIKYISTSYLQPITEAINDDASGFISIDDVNAFIIACPTGWSIPQWLAFWAAGWHANMSNYVESIYYILKRLHDLRSNVLQQNLHVLDGFLVGDTFDSLDMLLRSTSHHTSSIEPQLSTLIGSFRKLEEAELSSSLNLHKLDSSRTVALLTGYPRIERRILPLLYLLLERCLQIVQFACRQSLPYYVLEEDSRAISTVFCVFQERMKELETTFRNHVDPASYFKRYAFGMFDSYYSDDLNDYSKNTLFVRLSSFLLPGHDNDNIEQQFHNIYTISDLALDIDDQSYEVLDAIDWADDGTFAADDAEVQRSAELRMKKLLCRDYSRFKLSPDEDAEVQFLDSSRPQPERVLLDRVCLELFLRLPNHQ
ncbi:hypothetical protein H0H93_016792, partial [Arthromyces matolae]